MGDPRIAKAARLVGHRLVLRNATEGDAAFVWRLRTNAQRNQYISSTSSRLSDQIDWLRRYQLDSFQAYFIVERADAMPIGTVRMYDARGTSFCWGSWIFREDEPFYHAVESALMVYTYGLLSGFDSAHFEVDKGNLSVCRFHENFGARCIGEQGQQLRYSIELNEIQSGLNRYRRFLPAGIAVIT